MWTEFSFVNSVNLVNTYLLQFQRYRIFPSGFFFIGAPCIFLQLLTNHTALQLAHKNEQLAYTRYTTKYLGQLSVSLHYLPVKHLTDRQTVVFAVC